MPTEFGSLPIGSRFDCTIGGVRFKGQKVSPFRLLKPHRTSFQDVNAFLLPEFKMVHGTHGYVALISDSEIVHVATKAA